MLTIFRSFRYRGATFGHLPCKMHNHQKSFTVRTFATCDNSQVVAFLLLPNRRLPLTGGQLVALRQNPHELRFVMNLIRQVGSAEHLDELFALPHVVVLKHSLTCPASACAYEEVKTFVKTYPTVPVYVIPVQTHRRAATYLAKHTGVRHESPQVFILNRGRVSAVASHFGITGRFLKSKVEVARQ
jgi:bacillithiol system protein YtxJ